MNALLVLYAGNLSGAAFEPLIGGKSSLLLALERSSLFPGVTKTIILAGHDFPNPESPVPSPYTERRDSWTVKAMLEAIAAHSAGFDLTYFAWADCPFLDPALAAKLADRHTRYAAEYSYADGWPYGLAPELLSPGTAAILGKILGDDDGGCIQRDSLFAVIQKDINAFDIETEISSVDLRCHRLSLCADSKRNLQLLHRFAETLLENPSRQGAEILPENSSRQGAENAENAEEGALSANHAQTSLTSDNREISIEESDPRTETLRLCASAPLRENIGKTSSAPLRVNIGITSLPDTAAVERIVAEKPDALRTLPAFFPVQVSGGCPQSCAYCPWPLAAGTVTEKREFMDAGRFDSLLEKIIAFAGDAVIDLSLWGEIALHPQKIELIEMVLRRPDLALIIETSGIGWNDAELERAAELAAKAAAPRRHPLPPLSWIVSLDCADPARYREMRGAGFAEANACAKKLLSLFPKDAYVQAVRTVGAEDDIEKFYRSWKEAAGNTLNVIIQKYDDFCGMLPKKQASDLSPVQRQPCWHLMRDMPVLLDGTVPLCRQQIAAPDGGAVLGNAFTEPLDVVWERGQRLYNEHCMKKYDSLCAGCDEYYTYNF